MVSRETVQTIQGIVDSPKWSDHLGQVTHNPNAL